MRISQLSSRVPWLPAVLAAVALLALGLAIGVRRRAPVAAPAMHAPETVAAEKIDPWKEAALKVEEDRGEDTGRKAKIEIPGQLKHYEDRRRFLASQVAAWREYRYETPHDFAELVAMIKRGELVEAPALGENFILYGVGLSASDEPFTHYDKETGESVTLYGSDDELNQEYAQLDESLKQNAEAVKELQAQLKEAPKNDKALRKKIDEEIKEKREEADALKDRRKLLDGFYKNQKRRAVLAAEHEEIASLARDFGGTAYDLSDPAARKELKVRLLSHVRPAALKVIEEVAASYRQKFGRHLPVTSLVRTDEYQRRLSKTNPNATLIEVAPHTVGLAFDIFYRFLTAEEQQHVMSDLARLRDEGRVEALRERRDHYHVFAYAEGRPPDERLIREQLGQKTEKKEEKPQKQAAAAKRGKKETRASAAKSRGRETKRAPQRSAQRREAPQRRRGARGGA
jgi:DNA-binding transcriptional ArsR family regulator